MQTLYADVPFAPNSKQELKQLMKFIDSDSEYAVYRRKTLRSKAYRAEIKVLRKFHRDLYKDRVDYKRIVGQCPWTASGLSAMCDRLAEKFRLPAWDVVGDANSAVPLQ